MPGTFVWILSETDARGKPTKVARRADEPNDTYEAALAAGTHALNAHMRARQAPAPA